MYYPGHLRVTFLNVHSFWMYPNIQQNETFILTIVNVHIIFKKNSY